jgi:hypothetical protein
LTFVVVAVVMVDLVVFTAMLVVVMVELAVVAVVLVIVDQVRLAPRPPWYHELRMGFQGGSGCLTFVLVVLMVELVMVELVVVTLVPVAALVELVVVADVVFIVMFELVVVAVVLVVVLVELVVVTFVLVVVMVGLVAIIVVLVALKLVFVAVVLVAVKVELVVVAAMFFAVVVELVVVNSSTGQAGHGLLSPCAADLLVSAMVGLVVVTLLPVAVLVELRERRDRRPRRAIFAILDYVDVKGLVQVCLVAQGGLDRDFVAAAIAASLLFVAGLGGLLCVSVASSCIMLGRTPDWNLREQLHRERPGFRGQQAESAPGAVPELAGDHREPVQVFQQP